MKTVNLGNFGKSLKILENISVDILKKLILRCVFLFFGFPRNLGKSWKILENLGKNLGKKLLDKFLEKNEKSGKNLEKMQILENLGKS